MPRTCKHITFRRKGVCSCDYIKALAIAMSEPGRLIVIEPGRLIVITRDVVKENGREEAPSQRDLKMILCWL